MYKNGGGSYAIDGISSQPQLVEKDLEAAMKSFDKHFRIVEEQLDKMLQKN